MANSYLNRTISSSPTNPDKFTVSMWVKRTGQGAEQVLLGSYASSNFRAKLQFKSNDKLEYYQVNDGSASTQLRTSRVFRDSNAWYHLVVQFDTSQGTASDRIKIYINNTQETAFDISDYPAQDLDMRLNQASQTLNIGQDGNSGNYFDGYISHLALADGQTYAPTEFGETDSTSGIWKFKSPSGLTFGDDGFHLKFENSGNLGLDSSGQGNNFTVNGNLKQALDTPSDSYAALNGAFNLSDNVLSYGNNKALNSNSNWKYVPTTLGVESGKWYAEYKVNKSSGYIMNGVVDMQYATSQDKNNYTHSGAGTGSVSIYSDSGEKYIAGSNTTYAGTYTTNDIIGVALDMDNSKVYFSKNGAWANGSGGWGSSTFDAAVGAISLPTTGTYTFAVSQRSGAYNEVNFGNGLFGITAISSAGSNGNGSLFEYDVPSGFYALNTKNINTYG